MAGASIQIEVDDRAVQQALQRMIGESRDLTDVFTEIGDYLIEVHQQRFVDEKSPDGEAWEPLSALTLSRKTNNSDKILTERGGLQDTLHYNAERQSLELFTTAQAA